MRVGDNNCRDGLATQTREQCGNMVWTFMAWIDDRHFAGADSNLYDRTRVGMSQRMNEMPDHTGIAVADFNRSKAFYEWRFRRRRFPAPATPPAQKPDKSSAAYSGHIMCYRQAGSYQLTWVRITKIFG
ncbi:MAG: hypothetical protein M3178_03885 [Pseudomonadota bacterium]|nr:hypothetical protein [Pseudomonadota bacterium]